MTKRHARMRLPRVEKMKTTKQKLKSPRDAPLISGSDGESLNPTSLKTISNVNSPNENSKPLLHSGSGYNNRKVGSLSPKHNIFVLGVDGHPLTPTTNARARKLMRDKQAKPVWNKFCQFGIQMLAEGNFLARLRMAILYSMAAKLNYLVVGTTNKSEYSLGYFTKWGDGAADLEPILDLYKTDVIKLAKYLSVPDEYITKEPSANLWDGQTDEKEIGMSYRELDKFLKGIENKREFKIKTAQQLNILKRIENSEHKRMNIPKCRL